MTDRIAGTLLMGLDVAVEFATLGEFRIVDPALAVPAPYDVQAAPLVRRPERSARPGPDHSLLPAPSTALARSAQAEATPPIRLRMPPRSSLRPVLPPAHARTRLATPVRPSSKAGPRSRGGSVQAGTQLCLFNR